MTCVRSTVVADNAVVAACEEIDNLAFAFIAPLEADDGGVGRGAGSLGNGVRLLQARECTNAKPTALVGGGRVFDCKNALRRLLRGGLLLLLAVGRRSCSAALGAYCRNSDV